MPRLSLTRDEANLLLSCAAFVDAGEIDEAVDLEERTAQEVRAILDSAMVKLARLVVQR